jgi:hypothetical protein
MRTAAKRVKRYIDDPQPIEELQSQLGAAATQFSQESGDLRFQVCGALDMQPVSSNVSSVQAPLQVNSLCIILAPKWQQSNEFSIACRQMCR